MFILIDRFIHYNKTNLWLFGSIFIKSKPKEKKYLCWDKSKLFIIQTVNNIIINYLTAKLFILSTPYLWLTATGTPKSWFISSVEMSKSWSILSICNKSL